MKRLFLPLALAACGSASPDFRGAQVTRVEVAGDVFDVRVRGRLAEAVRRNPEYAPRLGPIGQRAGLAMSYVSGCEVVGVLGDQAVVTGVLDCDARPKNWARPAAVGATDGMGHVD